MCPLANQAIVGHMKTTTAQIAMFASTSGGKVHAANKISHTATCGAAVELDSTPMLHIHTRDERVHPMACKRCVTAVNRPGFMTTGVEQ